MAAAAIPSAASRVGGRSALCRPPARGAGLRTCRARQGTRAAIRGRGFPCHGGTKDSSAADAAVLERCVLGSIPRFRPGLYAFRAGPRFSHCAACGNGAADAGAAGATQVPEPGRVRRGGRGGGGALQDAGAGGGTGARGRAGKDVGGTCEGARGAGPRPGGRGGHASWVLSPEEARALQAAHRDKLKNARAKVSREDARLAPRPPPTPRARRAPEPPPSRGEASPSPSTPPRPRPRRRVRGGWLRARGQAPCRQGGAQLAEMIKVRRAFSPAPFAAAATLADR